MPKTKRLDLPRRRIADASMLTVLKPISIRHRVIDLLRNAIITQELRPGQRITEEEICGKLGVSRGPVREALRQLEQEGLVMSQPFKSTEVVAISKEEVREILMPMRMILEQFGFSHAAKVLTADDFIHLDHLVDRMRESGRRRDVLLLNSLDVEFHDYVLSVAAQPHCLQLWRIMQPRIRAYFFQWTKKDTTGLEEVADQHEVLLKVLQSRKVKDIKKALENHINDPDPVEI